MKVVLALLACAVLGGHPALTHPAQAASFIATPGSQHRHSQLSSGSRQLLQEYDGYDDEYLEDEYYEEDVAQPSGPGGGSTAAKSTPGAPPGKVRRTNRTRKGTIANKEVAFAPLVNVTFGDDIDDEGKCEKEIEKYCKEFEQGEGKLADCMSDIISEIENPEIGDRAGDPLEVSDECREEVYLYKITRSTNINYNIPLARACKVDAEKFCNVTWFFGYKQGQIIECLREYKKQLSKPCRRQVHKVQKAAAEDMRADPTLWEACKSDAESLCKDVKHGGGRVQACLRDKRMQLHWMCDEQLFRQEIENADDIRLSVRLFARCMPDKRKFCNDIEPGNARTKECLEEHRKELSESCRTEIDSMIERRAQDFRLDSKLRSACEAEITNMCAYMGDLDDMDTYDSSVINCLQDYSSEIKSQECKRQVKKYLILASSDIRFDVTLAKACYKDRVKYCGQVPPGSARVIRCLTRQREKLDTVCRATLFDEEVRFSENIDFQYPMKEACQSELNKFCKDVPHGNARAIRCLQDNKDNKDFGKACRDEVVAYEAEISKDYRLNFRLNKNCAKDIGTLCSNICSQNDGSVCGGKVLRCLTDKVEDIKSEACKQEVFYYQKMEVENYQNDIILAEACRSDVEKYCANVEPGSGRVHKCLRDNRKKLSDACRKEELLLEEQEANNVELSQGLLRSCKAERQIFCRDVKPGSARVFRCLAENMNDPDFSGQCKYQVMYKLQRRQANWKLDPPLRKACRSDVYKYCLSEDQKNSEEGLVYKCLINNVASLTSGCGRELSRAVHMALFAWQPGAILTSDCDEDINKYCLAARPNMINRPGAIGSCLASILERQDMSQRGARRRLADEAPKQDAPKQEAPKQEAPKQEAPKEQPKKEEPKKEEPKKEEPKKEEPKQEEPKQEAPKEEPKKEEPKKEEPKKEEPKKEEPKKEEAPKQEEPKKEEALKQEAAKTEQAAPEVTVSDPISRTDDSWSGAMSDNPTANFKALVGAKLSPACYMLADIAEPPNMKQAFDKSLSFALLKSQLDSIDRMTGLSLVTRNARGKAEGVSLTGWVAMAGMAALILLMVFGLFTLYKRFRGIPDRDYTLVVKQQHK